MWHQIANYRTVWRQQHIFQTAWGQWMANTSASKNHIVRVQSSLIINIFSVVLMAVVNAEYCFTSVDIGSYGSSSDSYVFERSNFGKKLNQGKLNIPPNQPLPNDGTGVPIPFIFVADEAYVLTDHIQCPYERWNLTRENFFYNYRLTRARRMVECAFVPTNGEYFIEH